MADGVVSRAYADLCIADAVLELQQAEDAYARALADAVTYRFCWQATMALLFAAWQERDKLRARNLQSQQQIAQLMGLPVIDGADGTTFSE